MVGLAVSVRDMLGKGLGEIARVIDGWMSSSALDGVIVLRAVDGDHELGERKGD
jgi:hypothetical protein